MSSEESGVIDLFEIHQRGPSCPTHHAEGVVSADIFGAPLPAFAIDLVTNPEDTSDNLRAAREASARRLRKKALSIAGATGVLLFLGIVVASVVGKTPVANAAASKAVTLAPAPPPPLATSAAGDPTPAAATTAVPAPPTTGAHGSPQKPPSRPATSPRLKAKPGAHK